MSDPINLNTASPGAFNQPTQPVENPLTPAVETLPKTVVSVALIGAANALTSTPVGAGGSMQTPTATMGSTPDQGCCSSGGGTSSSGGGGGTGNWVFNGDDASRVTSGLLTIGADGNITSLTITPVTIWPFADSQGPFTHDLSLGPVADGTWMKITAGDPGRYTDWYGTFASFTNPAFRDDVYRQGFNVAPGGGAVIAGRAVLHDAWESYYDGSNHQVERHIQYQDPAGNVTRALSFLGSIDAPDYTTTLLLQYSTTGAGGTVMIQAQGGAVGATGAWSVTDATIAGGNGRYRIQAGNGQVLMYDAIGNNGRVGVGSDRVFLGGNTTSDQNNAGHGWDLGIAGGEFWVGRFASQILTPAVDTLAAGTLALGGTTATSVQISRTGQSVGFFGTGPVVQQTVGAVTNNVTAGGVDGTIANYTDLVTYANDAAAIRNDIYQLARSVAQLTVAVRNYGLGA